MNQIYKKNLPRITSYCLSIRLNALPRHTHQAILHLSRLEDHGHNKSNIRQ